jgi:hypothetical protein
MLPSFVSSLLAAAPLALLSAAPGCASPPQEPSEEEEAMSQDGPGEDTGEAREDLLGSASYAGDCSPALVSFLDTVHFYGRVAAASRAFEQCVDRAMRVQLSTGGGPAGPYRQCNGDPFYNQPVNTQLQSVLDAARSGNDVFMSCGGSSGLASAAIGSYDSSGAEAMAWSSWLPSAVAQLSEPLCANGSTVGCRAAPAPWPYSQAAGSMWHEAMHQHGYSHGANNATDARPACGYSGDPTWDFQVNTLPYIVGKCVADVIDRSGAACGALDTCGPGQLKLVTGFGDTTCRCAGDPRGVDTRPSNAFTHITTLGNTGGAMTTLDHPLLNGHADALVQFTHVWNPPGGGAANNGNHTVAFYNYGTGRWVLWNTTGAQMPLGTGFFVRAGRGAVHRTSAANINGHATRINHPLAMGDPLALVTVSPTPYAGQSSGNVDSHPIGVWYDGQGWTIFNQDFAPMPPDVGFTVELETQYHRGLQFVHKATPSNISGHLTRLSSPWLDGRPDARFLVTPDFTRGPVFDNSDIGVYFDGFNWWVYNEQGSDPGLAMPNGAAFVIEVLRDEIQRWVTVPESTYGVDTGIDAVPGDRLHIHGSGRLWSGTWLSPTVGPEGESGLPYNGSFPMSDVNRFSLIGSFVSDGYFASGRDLWRSGPSSFQRLSLRTNDDWPGNGSGFFEAEVRVFR